MIRGKGGREFNQAQGGAGGALGIGEIITQISLGKGSEGEVIRSGKEIAQ